MEAPYTTRMLLAFVLGIAAATGNVLGGLFVTHREWSRQFLKYFLALGAGFMLAAAFLEVIPESIRLAGDRALVLVLAGYFVVHFFEHTLAPHFHFGEETHVHEVAAAHVGTAALLGLLIHTFFDGVAIASGFLVSTWLGGVLFTAVFLHKLPEGFTVASLMLASGKTRRSAFLSSGLLGAATIGGVLLMAVLRGQLAYALPVSGGVTLYVAASDLIPEVNREHAVRMPLLVFLGLALMFLLEHFLRF